MPSLSIDLIFETVLRIHLFEERAISFTFAESGIRIKLPTTRKLAEFLDVPHYYVLPCFVMMEQKELVTRAERVGIMTTPAGTARYLTLMEEQYPAEGVAVLGPVIYTELTGRVY